MIQEIHSKLHRGWDPTGLLQSANHPVMLSEATLASRSGRETRPAGTRRSALQVQMSISAPQEGGVRRN